MIVKDQPYITYEQMIRLCRLWLLGQWFGLHRQK